MIKYIFKIMIAPNVIDFEAIITDNVFIDYIVIKDFCGLYEDMFLEVLKGEFNMQYIENDKLKCFSLSSKTNSVLNIQEFCLFSKKLFGFTASLELSV